VLAASHYRLARRHESSQELARTGLATVHRTQIPWCRGRRSAAVPRPSRPTRRWLAGAIGLHAARAISSPTPADDPHAI